MRWHSGSTAPDPGHRGDGHRGIVAGGVAPLGSPQGRGKVVVRTHRAPVNSSAAMRSHGWNSVSPHPSGLDGRAARLRLVVSPAYDAPLAPGIDVRALRQLPFVPPRTCSGRCRLYAMKCSGQGSRSMAAVRRRPEPGAGLWAWRTASTALVRAWLLGEAGIPHAVLCAGARNPARFSVIPRARCERGLVLVIASRRTRHPPCPGRRGCRAWGMSDELYIDFLSGQREALEPRPDVAVVCRLRHLCAMFNDKANETCPSSAASRSTFRIVDRSVACGLSPRL